MHALKRKSPLRRMVLAGAATVSGMVLLLSMKPHSTAGVAVAAPAPSNGAHASAGFGGSGGSGGSGSSGDSGGSGGSGSSGSSGGSGGSSGSSGSATTGTRTVTGESVQTRYGPVQVRITLKHGRLTDVTAVSYPQDSPRDQEINSYAVPQLTREALAAQSAGIEAVSGATYTSQGYQQSLQSALDAARG
ncbi:FMN-binding protein [Streptomyces hygroscopicus]|uniref:FMN-binding protein n=1 Tax=Streptomyces hygroscopicus TaxID=1912 RepID=UPI00224065E3|nr:FMN-binding protein [Streptomyces hygroscopicus]MCW7940984.1 FMN-binding protein [Streptomyces hygroscopicus]